MSDLDISQYEVIPPHLSSATQMIVELWDRTGRPTNPLSEQGQKVVNFVFETYKELFPQEYNLWLEKRKEYKLNEWEIKDQIRKHTGRSLLSYPYWVFMVLKKVFPNFDFVKRENALKIAKKFPQFQIANKR